MNNEPHARGFGDRRALRTILRCGYLVAGIAVVEAPPTRFFIAIDGWVPFWKWSATRPFAAAGELYCMLVTLVAFTVAELYLPAEARREGMRAALRKARATGQRPTRQPVRQWWRFKPTKKQPRK